MNRRKLFIGISVDDETASRLRRKLESFSDLPVIWTPKENMHITLVFLGHVDDDRLTEITSALNESCEGMEPFDIGLSRITLGPDTEMPKTIWVEGEASEELKRLQRHIEISLGALTREKNAFRPHVTLGRIKRAKWNALKEKPSIAQDVRFSVPVSTVSLFESIVEDKHRRYVPIDSVDLS